VTERSQSEKSEWYTLAVKKIPLTHIPQNNSHRRAVTPGTLNLFRPSNGAARCPNGARRRHSQVLMCENSLPHPLTHRRVQLNPADPGSADFLVDTRNSSVVCCLVAEHPVDCDKDTSRSLVRSSSFPPWVEAGRRGSRHTHTHTHRHTHINAHTRIHTDTHTVT